MATTYCDYLKFLGADADGPVESAIYQINPPTGATARFCFSPARGFYLCAFQTLDGTVLLLDPDTREERFSLILTWPSGAVAARYDSPDLGDLTAMARTVADQLRPLFEALTAVRDYLWDDELRRFQGEPSADHVFRHLVVLENWLSGTESVADDFAAAVGEVSPE